MGSCEACLFVQNFGAVLVVIVISAGDAIFAKFHKKLLKCMKLHISRHMVCCFFQEAVFLGSAVDSEGPGPGPGPGPGAQHGPKNLVLGGGSVHSGQAPIVSAAGGGRPPSLPTPVAAATGRPPPGQKCLLLLRRPGRPFKKDMPGHPGTFLCQYLTS